MRQYQDPAKPKSVGKEDELNAWTSSFIRDFKRSYTITQKGKLCYIDKYQTFSQLAMYYEDPTVRQPARDNAVKRISDYFDANLRGYRVITGVFALWLKHGAKGQAPALAQAVQIKLPDVVPQDKNARLVDCSDAQAAKYPAPPAIDIP